MKCVGKRGRGSKFRNYLASYNKDCTKKILLTYELKIMSVRYRNTSREELKLSQATQNMLPH